MKPTSRRQPAPMDADADFQVPNLERGLSVLELLSRHPDGLPASEIAKRIGIPMNSAGRILGALTARGFLARHEISRAYTLTRKLLILGSPVVSETHLIDESLAVMKSLRDQTGETVLLGTVVDDESVILEAVPSRHPVRLMVDPGTRSSLHCAAPGKLALALMDDAERQAVLGRITLERITERTIANRRELERECEQIRTDGYALDRGEGIEGVHCVAAPIHDRNGIPTASLTVTGPSLRLPVNRLKELVPLVVMHADQITRRLKYGTR
jgi:IclR family transcriptional regulator, acetate operon repressor